jgi:hypothetical protein
MSAAGLVVVASNKQQTFGHPPTPELLCLIFFTGLVLTTSSEVSARARCSQYGDPPAAFHSDPVPTCPGGQLLGPWPDSDGHNRYACLWDPGATESAPLPMIVFLHPSTVTADSISVDTDLLSYLSTANVSGDPSRLGFILLAPEGRNTHHYYPFVDMQGPGWDNWYRNFVPPTVAADLGATGENVDAAGIDHFIDLEQATGKVDANRVYLSGWSNGAGMAYAYGLNRSTIAAIGVYSAPDPWAFLIDPCEQVPIVRVPKGIRKIRISNPSVPTYQVHNGCDLAGLCPNSERMMKRLRRIGVHVEDQIIGLASQPVNPDNQQPATRCFSLCGSNPNGSLNILGELNHDRWPTDWTQSILDFFRNHPLSGTASAPR